ncbi:MAG TPA: glycosyltransferase family 39 protein [Candidatus Acidoferrales bacterium]|nr:glycosyltransferase family 39 protein [Candidatus Acidoferrales bacterium]
MERSPRQVYSAVRPKFFRVRGAVQLSASTLWLLRLGVFTFIASLYFLQLGAGALWDNSETTYGEIVKELFRTGDFLTLHFNFHPWLIHPPLWFWIAAASVRAFGLNEFALRLPSAAFGMLTALAVYLAGRRMYGEIAGLIAVLAAAGCLEWVMLARIAILDTMLVTCMTVATFWIFFAVHDRDRGAFWIAVVAAALGTLAKGPVAIVLPILILAGYWAWQTATHRPVRIFEGLPWLAGTVVYIAIAGSWFAAAALVHGAGFLSYYFGVSNVGRFLTPFENQPGPFWYYIPVVAAGFFPYIAFVPKAIKTAWQSGDDAARYLLVATILPFIFFSVAQTKLPNYIAAIFPSLGILVGRVVSDALERNDVKALRGALIVLPASLVLIAIVAVFYGETQVAGPFHALAPALELLAWFVIPPAIATWLVTYLTNRVWVAPVGLAVVMGGLIYAVIFSILPRAEAFKPMKGMAQTVMSYYRPGDQIGTAGLPGGISLLFYTDGDGVTWVGDSEDDAHPKDFFDQPARVLCVVRPQDAADFEQQGVKLWVLRREPKLWLVSNRPN